jgi:hypothetical protein
MNRQDSTTRLTSSSFLSIFMRNRRRFIVSCRFSCGKDVDSCSTGEPWIKVWPGLFLLCLDFFPLASPVPELSIPELINIEMMEEENRIFEEDKVRRAQEKLLQENSPSCTDLYFQSEFGRKSQFEEVILLSSNALISLLRRSSVSRATKSRVKSKGSIRQLQRIMLGIIHRIYESRDESQVRTC